MLLCYTAFVACASLATIDTLEARHSAELLCTTEAALNPFYHLPNIGALIIRIGFWCPKTYLGPYIKPSTRDFIFLLLTTTWRLLHTISRFRVPDFVVRVWRLSAARESSRNGLQLI